MSIVSLESRLKLTTGINIPTDKQIPTVRAVSSSTEAVKTVSTTHDLTSLFEEVENKNSKFNKRHILINDIDSESKQFIKISSSGRCAFLASIANYICSCLSSTKEKIDNVIINSRQDAIIYSPLEVTVNSDLQLDNQNIKLTSPKSKKSFPAIKFKQKCIVPGYNITAGTRVKITLFADSVIRATDLTEERLKTFPDLEQANIVEYSISKNTSLNALVLIIIDSKPNNSYNETMLGVNETELTNEKIILMDKKQVCNLRLKYN